MRIWPSLKEKAFYLKGDSPGAGIIFFYDTPPENKAASPPVFVLIHGLGDEADSWRHVIPLLNAKGYRVLAPDLCGFGRSVAPKRISLKAHVSSVVRLLDTIPPTSRIVLAGNSMGAVIAEAAAIQRPKQAQGLVLLDGSIPGGPANPGVFALLKMLFSHKWYRSYRQNPDRAWASLYPYYADLDNMSAADREFLCERVMARVKSSSQERAFFATQRTLVRLYINAYGFTRGIRNYEGKILLLWGEKDKIVPVSSTDRLRTLRPGAELEIIPGAGHLPQQEKPGETARLMIDFAKRC